MYRRCIVGVTFAKSLRYGLERDGRCHTSCDLKATRQSLSHSQPLTSTHL